MNHDKQNFWLILLLFPLAYFATGAFYTCYEIYLLGNYEPKSGRWGSFQISLAFFGFMTFLASPGYWIGLAWLKTEPQQMPRPRLALITVLSALLSWVALRAITIIMPHLASELFLPVLIFLPICVCLCPALAGISLVKIHRSWFAAYPSTQR